MNKYECSIVSVDKLNHDVYQVILLLPQSANEEIYNAGQYLDLHLPNGKKASFSIGSAPESGLALEVYIKHNHKSTTSTDFIEYLLSEASIQASVGKGAAIIQAETLHSDETIVLVAASTGFSQVKSVVEHLLAQRVKNQIHIYWGGRVDSDLYCLMLPEKWAEQHSNVTFHPVVTNPTKEWTGRTGLLPLAVPHDFRGFEGVKMLASGSPAMVYALLDACENKGLTEHQFISDVMAYSPRPSN